MHKALSSGKIYIVNFEPFMYHSIQFSAHLCDSAVSVVLCALSAFCHVWSKTRSLGQIFEKPCVHSRGHISSLIIMKFGQNVCLDEISDELEMGYVGSKTRSLGQILEKPCVHSRDHIFSRIIMKLGKNVCLQKLVVSGQKLCH